MFSMCSKLTPRARIPDTRIPQLMQPWVRSAFGNVYFIVPPFDYSFTFLFFYYDHASTLDRIWACRASHTCVRLLFRFFRIRSLFFACCRFCLRSWSPGREVEKQARFWPEVEFVNAVAAGGSENFFARGVNFSRNNAIYNRNESTKYILSWFHL